METGLLHEPAAAALRQVRRWPRPPRSTVPAGARLLVEAVEVLDVFHGYADPLPGWRGAGSGEALTEAAAYADLDFAQAPPEGIAWQGPLRAARDGAAHALRLRTVTRVAPGISAGSSPAYCTPVVLPLPAPLPLRAGEAREAALRYDFAFTGEPVRYDLR
jgi:predicted RNA methylase